MPHAASDDDPKPQPPVRPDLEDCCHSGCSPCVFDLYDEALARYEIALAEWEKRQSPHAGRTEPAPRARRAPQKNAPDKSPRGKRR